MRPFGWVALVFNNSRTMVGCLCGGCSPLKTPPREILGAALVVLVEPQLFSGPIGSRAGVKLLRLLRAGVGPQAKMLLVEGDDLGSKSGRDPWNFPQTVQGRRHLLLLPHPAPLPTCTPALDGDMA